MKQGFKRIVSMALIASMIATMAPSTAWAASVDDTDAAQVEAQTAVDEEAAPVVESAADTEAVETETETEPAATEETETAVETETETQTETETEADKPVYTIGDININFHGANAAVAEQLAKDVEIDESDPAIQSLRKALEDIEIEGGEGNQEDNSIAVYSSDIATYSPDKEGKAEPLTEEQIQTVVGMYQNYLNQWKANANVLGVQNPFFLDFNDDKDGLGILGEMLALDGGTVDDIRKHNYSYDDLTGMILNFLYGDQLGIQYYGEAVINARDKALAAVDALGDDTTTAQKLLVLNDWLAHNNTFDMSYIMNSGKAENEKPMVAENPQERAHEKDVHDAIYKVYEKQITQNFHDNFYANIKHELLVNFYKKAIANVLVQGGQSEDDANAYVEANKAAIEKDPEAFVKENFPDAADALKEQADAFIKQAETEGEGIATDESKPDEKYTIEQMTQGAMASEKAVDLDGDGEKDTTANDAIPIYAEQAATGMTDGILNYWEGTQFGALGMGTSVCLGYSKAYSYLVQCLDKDIYLVDPSKGYDHKVTVTADDGTSSEVCDNWKESKDLYYTDGKLDISKNYTVDLVRISFQSDVTMYGEEQPGFASDHYWNAVKVDGQWYYVDPCYTDVYTEVMSRDRVETDGDMNHVFFLFSDTDARKLYQDNFSVLRSLYQNKATDTTYEKAWMARAASNVYYADGYAYYLYDSTDLFDRVNNNSMTQNASEYKLVRHKLTSDDKTNGDSDYETLINFTDTKKSDDTATSDTSDSTSDETFVSVLNKDGKMEKSDALTKLYTQFTNDQAQYPSLSLTAALYDGKLYFNLSNDVLAYNLADNTVAVVKEYNEVSAKRDTTKLFGGMAFTTTTSKDDADFTVTNHPIAGLTVKGDDLIVSIGTNFAFISGKSSITDQKHFGYAFEETDYNSGYTNYKKYQQYMGSQKNDNDEFMWSANFVDTVNLKKLTGDSHNFETVSVPATCGRNAFTEERCSDCGLIKDGTRVEEEGTAHEHHYIKFHETYYTKDDNGNWNEADNYVCPECGASSTEPVKSQFSQAESNYEKKKAIWEEAQKNAAEGHAYTATDAEWSDDHTSVTFQNLKCETCANQINKLDCLLESDTNKTNKANRDSIEKTLAEKVTATAELVGHTGTCDQGVTSTYKATGKTDDGYRYTASDKKTSDAGQHQYTGTWAWTEVKDDNGNVTGYTASVTGVKCAVCDDEPKAEQITVADAVKDTENSVAATCTEKGKDVYTATATVKDAEGKTEIGTLTGTHEVELAALEHKYGEPTWNWNDDHTEATAVFACERGDDTQEVKATITEKTTAATCETAGETVYTATASFGGKDYTDNQKVEIAALGHKYGEPTWTWSDDNKTATATFTCANDKAHVQEVKATVTPETTAATCTEAGKTVYTATATFDGKDYTTTKEVEIAALGHKYGEPTWNWTKGENNTYTATATFTCANDEKHVETVDAKVTEKSEGATCTEAGKITYTAAVTFEGKDYTATKTEEVAALGHNYGEPTWNWSKGDDGSYTAIATFTCDRCKDVQKVVATVGDPVETKATCEADGKTVYTAKVTFNGKDYTDTKEEAIKAIGHKYGEPTWNWEKAENNTYKATATFTCANDASHVEKVTVKAEEKSEGATCTEAGKIVYTAKVTFEGKDYTDSKEETVEALGHDYQTTITKATLSKDGSIVTKCTRCGDVKENTTIPYPKTITLSADHYVYDGQEKKPEVSVVGSDGKAISADNYDVKYPESAVAGGSYDVVITFKGNYEGTVTKTFTIGQMDSELKYAKSSVTVDYKGGAVVNNAYTSKASAKDIKFTTSNKNVAAVDSEGNVTIVGPGTATITAQISGSESYKDAKAAYTVKVNSLATPAVPKVTNGKDGAVVTWSAVKNAETYSVWRKTSSTGWKKLGTVEGTTYTDKTAESNQTYYYTIRCMNADKNICTSDYNRTGTKAYYLAASNISSLTLTSNGIVVKWNKVAGAKSYRIYRKTTGGYTRIGTVNSGDTTSYTDKTAESGKTYTYAVKPYNGNDSADYTGKQVTYLAAPTLSTLANAAAGVSLKWNSISGAQKYYIYRKEGNGGYKKIAEVKDAVSYTDKSVTSGKNYTYAVRALKGSSMSAYTGKSINYLAQATVSALNNKDNGIEVKWSKVSGAKGYYVYRKEGKNSYQKIATITNANTTSYTDTSVKNNNGKAYTYTVRAYANNALAAYTGKSVYRIATPTIKSASNSKAGQVAVDWNDVKGAKGYQVQAASTSAFSKDDTDEAWVDYADGSDITITDCEKGETLYVRVRAYKQNGSGTKYYSAWSTKSVKVTK